MLPTLHKLTHPTRKKEDESLSHLKQRLRQFADKGEIKACAQGTRDVTRHQHAAKTLAAHVAELQQHKDVVRSSAEVRHIISKDVSTQLLQSILMSPNSTAVATALKAAASLTVLAPKSIQAEMASTLISLLDHQASSAPHAAEMLVALLPQWGTAALLQHWAQQGGSSRLAQALQRSTASRWDPRPLLLLVAKLLTVSSSTAALLLAEPQDATRWLELLCSMLKNVDGLPVPTRTAALMALDALHGHQETRRILAHSAALHTQLLAALHSAIGRVDWGTEISSAASVDLLEAAAPLMGPEFWLLGRLHAPFAPSRALTWREALARCAEEAVVASTKALPGPIHQAPVLDLSSSAQHAQHDSAAVHHEPLAAAAPGDAPVGAHHQHVRGADPGRAKGGDSLRSDLLRGLSAGLRLLAALLTPSPHAFGAAPAAAVAGPAELPWLPGKPVLECLPIALEVLEGLPCEAAEEACWRAVRLIMASPGVSVAYLQPLLDGMLRLVCQGLVSCREAKSGIRAAPHLPSQPPERMCRAAVCLHAAAAAAARGPGKGAGHRLEELRQAVSESWIRTWHDAAPQIRAMASDSQMPPSATGADFHHFYCQVFVHPCACHDVHKGRVAACHVLLLLGLGPLRVSEASWDLKGAAEADCLEVLEGAPLVSRLEKELHGLVGWMEQQASGYPKPHCPPAPCHSLQDWVSGIHARLSSLLLLCSHGSRHLPQHAAAGSSTSSAATAPPAAVHTPLHDPEDPSMTQPHWPLPDVVVQSLQRLASFQPVSSFHICERLLAACHPGCGVARLLQLEGPAGGLPVLDWLMLQEVRCLALAVLYRCNGVLGAAPSELPSTWGLLNEGEGLVDVSFQIGSSPHPTGAHGAVLAALCPALLQDGKQSAHQPPTPPDASSPPKKQGSPPQVPAAPRRALQGPVTIQLSSKVDAQHLDLVLQLLHNGSVQLPPGWTEADSLRLGRMAHALQLWAPEALLSGMGPLPGDVPLGPFPGFASLLPHSVFLLPPVDAGACTGVDGTACTALQETRSSPYEACSMPPARQEPTPGSNMRARPAPFDGVAGVGASDGSAAWPDSACQQDPAASTHTRVAASMDAAWTLHLPRTFSVEAALLPPFADVLLAAPWTALRCTCNKIAASPAQGLAQSGICGGCRTAAAVVLIPAHRALLAAQAEYFAVAFSSRWRAELEAQPSKPYGSVAELPVTAVPEVDAETTLALLQLLYTGQLAAPPDVEVHLQHAQPQASSSSAELDQAVSAAACQASCSAATTTTTTHPSQPMTLSTVYDVTGGLPTHDNAITLGSRSQADLSPHPPLHGTGTAPSQAEVHQLGQAPQHAASSAPSHAEVDPSRRAPQHAASSAPSHAEGACSQPQAALSAFVCNWPHDQAAASTTVADKDATTVASGEQRQQEGEPPTCSLRDPVALASGCRSCRDAQVALRLHRCGAALLTRVQLPERCERLLHGRCCELALPCLLALVDEAVRHDAGWAIECIVGAISALCSGGCTAALASCADWWQLDADLQGVLQAELRRRAPFPAGTLEKPHGCQPRH